MIQYPIHSKDKNMHKFWNEEIKYYFTVKALKIIILGGLIGLSISFSIVQLLPEKFESEITIEFMGYRNEQFTIIGLSTSEFLEKIKIETKKIQAIKPDLGDTVQFKKDLDRLQNYKHAHYIKISTIRNSEEEALSSAKIIQDFVIKKYNFYNENKIRSLYLTINAGLFRYPDISKEKPLNTEHLEEAIKKYLNGLNPNIINAEVSNISASKQQNKYLFLGVIFGILLSLVLVFYLKNSKKLNSNSN